MKKPLAFMSYARRDNRDRYLTELRERLSEAVGMLTGEDFDIFQDENSIEWGQRWRERIEQSLDEVTFLIPIVTPRFFNSQHCRDELQQFLDREEELGRSDLILPIYYVSTPLLDDEDKRKTNKLAQEIHNHQYADWRELRHEPFSSPEIRRRLDKLGERIGDVLVQAREPRETSDRGQDSLGSQNSQPTAGSAETTKGPAAKTEPPIHIVDPMNRGNHTTISKAIEAAAPGDRILVQPGTYEEGLVIDKPLEIIGEGDRGQIEVRAEGQDVVLFKTSMGRVSNLTLKQVDGDNSYGVNISQGRLDLEDCNITSQSLSCVAVHGGAEPRVRRNNIYEGQRSGVLIYGQHTLGTFENNLIYGNAEYGVEIREGANPTLRGNSIRRNEAGGVLVHQYGQGTLEDNEIRDNTWDGVTIREGANPTLRNNRIHGGRAGGVLIHQRGQGTLKYNEIYDNAYSGVAIREDANPTLHRNRIYNCRQNGIYVDEGAQGTLEYDNIYDNSHYGVEIKSQGHPTLRHSLIRRCEKGGVLIHQRGQGTLKYNEIYDNAYSGVAIRHGANATLRENKINKNSGHAICVDSGGGGTFEDNDLTDNSREAWDVSEDSEPKVRRARNKE